MNGFFGVGPLELLVIGILALIFIGPERLPGVISQVMRTVRELRDYATQVQDELRGEFAEVRQELEGVARDMDQFSGDLSRSANEVVSGAQQAVDSATAGTSTPSTAAGPAAGTAFEPAPPPTTFPELNAPPPPRDMTPLPAPTAAHTNGVARDDEESRPTFADYRPE